MQTFEITVRYVASESEQVTLPSPNALRKVANGSVSTHGTRIHTDTGSLTSTTTESPRTAVPVPKISVYEASDYRVENGVLVIDTNYRGGSSNNGFIIPLTAIQEVKVVDMNSNEYRRRETVQSVVGEDYVD